MKKLLIVTLLVVLAFVLEAEYAARFNKPATEIKERVDRQYAAFIRAAKVGDVLNLSKIGGEEWDYICMANSYRTGESWARRYVQIKDLSAYKKADLWFDDAQSGLVFINKKTKILISLSLEKDLSSRNSKSICMSATNVKISLNQSNAHEYLKIIGDEN